ncbi:MAG: hypothetical protein QOE26_889 [Verrucomicrobiota bacterium]|jgi:hypothetical protein
MISKQRKRTHGGKRKGAGKKSQGKAPYTVTLTKTTVDGVKKAQANFSGLLDRLLDEWLQREKAA